MKIIDFLIEIEKNRIIPNSIYRININGYNVIVKFLYFDLVIIDFAYSGEVNYLNIKIGESLFKYFRILSILGYRIEKDNRYRTFLSKLEG